MKIELGRNNKERLQGSYNYKLMKGINFISEKSWDPLYNSFAIHLHESRFDLRYIQERFGFKSSKTTEIFTYVSKTRLANIESPFDRLMKEERA